MTTEKVLQMIHLKCGTPKMNRVTFPKIGTSFFFITQKCNLKIQIEWLAVLILILKMSRADKKT